MTDAYNQALQQGNRQNQMRADGSSWDKAEYVNATEAELNEYQFSTLVGFTDELGAAWHRDDARRGDAEDNHYPGAIPVEDVRRRLFSWRALEAPLFVRVPAGPDDFHGFEEGFETKTDADGNEIEVPVTNFYRYVEATGRKGIVRSDNDLVMGVFKSGYKPHQYDEWLTKQIENLLDDGLCIGSAGLLKDGAVAHVQIRLREQIATQDGKILPYLLGTTSFDGSVATTYLRCITRDVCKNTLRIAKAEGGAKVKIKHTANSHLKLDSARVALGLIEAAAEDYIAAMDQLLAIDVTDQQFRKIVNEVWEMPKEDGRSKTMAETRHSQVFNLWQNDARVKPVAGTAWGVLQAFNTWQHHVQNVRGDRAERNVLNVIDGGFDSFDAEVMAAAGKVLVPA